VLFWFLTPCEFVGRYQLFGETNTCSLLSSAINTETGHFQTFIPEQHYQHLYCSKNLKPHNLNINNPDDMAIMTEKCLLLLLILLLLLLKTTEHYSKQHLLLLNLSKTIHTVESLEIFYTELTHEDREGLHWQSSGHSVGKEIPILWTKEPVSTPHSKSVESSPKSNTQ
jgi:hypothetical protein